MIICINNVIEQFSRVCRLTDKLGSRDNYNFKYLENIKILLFRKSLKQFNILYNTHTRYGPWVQQKSLLSPRWTLSVEVAI